MSVTLEPVQTEIAEEPIAEEIPEVSAESTAEIQNPIPEVEEPIAEIEEAIPQPKKRGRPKAAPKEKAKKTVPKKAVIMKPPSESSDERFVDWFFFLRDNQGVAFPCHHDLICHRRYFLRVVSL